jgi:hypothetical protein
MIIGLICIDEIGTAGHYFETARIFGPTPVRLVNEISRPTLFASHVLLLVVDPMLRNPKILRTAPFPVASCLMNVHQYLDLRLAYSHYFDHVLVAQPDCLNSFVRLPHPSVYVLPLACDPDVCFLPGEERIFEVGFVGEFSL